MVSELEENLIRRVNVGDIVTRNAASRPLHTAVVDGARRFTWRDFNAWVNRIAHGLTEQGLRRGDALAIMSRNCAEFLAVYFACAKIGVVCVPCNLLWRRSELEYVLAHSEVRGIVLQAEFLGQLDGIRATLPRLEHVVIVPDGCGAEVPSGALSFDALQAGRRDTDPEIVVHDDDPLSYLYTSGTTSAPKGVVSSHLSIYLAALGVALDTGLTFRDRALALLPLFHTSPLNSLCTPAAAAGATIYIHPGFDAGRILDLFQDEGITVLLALPMMYRAMLDLQDREPRRIEKLRLALYAMAPMPDHELKRAIATFGCDFGLIFGQTEMAPVTTFFRPEHQLTHSGAAGTPSTGVQVGIMDEEGRLLAAGEVGEIVYRGPQALSGYLKNAAATEEAFRHGWFHSGDVGHFDEDGLLWFKDRLKDVVKTGGENVASVEVEQALYDVEPDIMEVVVIGLPHAHWEEAVTAVVVARDGGLIDEAAVLARLRGRLSPYKIPKSLIVVDAFPKTATGKIQKVELRARFADHYASEAKADVR